ncbi:RHS repeat-associated core domain-containing protein [Chitinophaga rupis]|uniref:RHS repeat-associated core domain-containing protein n=1 Tax=Chitinophaga rupis TaxID=573321 RepID=A0A1H7S9K1_9BACT|nr:DUF6443 domain-containing protein [Chitinophaga rupis]SEL69302.1 RHS repeat-associated core domain-containing protein [Chitinophaga rupis]
MRSIISYILKAGAGLALLGISFSLSAQNKPDTSTRATATAVATPGAYTNTTINYIRTWEPSMPTSDPAAVTSSTDVNAVKQSTQYFDGLGRPLQAVTKAFTPGAKDLVEPVVYDVYGREQYKYLPYVPKTGNTGDGKFKTDPFNGQKAFYQDATLAPGAAGETIYYWQTEYEASPLNRVLKTYAPGNSWAKGNTRGDKPVELQYQVNSSADSVRIWDLPNTGNLPTSVNGRVYGAGQLLKNVTKDERGLRTIEYTNKLGQVVLKKVELLTGTTAAHVGWLCTYYVYDDIGNLRCIIPPKAVVNINTNWTIDVATAGELCFFYRYDGFNRMIIKKIPGADSTEMVYDVRDRLAFSRDGAQRQRGQWVANFYDSLNRQSMIGLYAAMISRDALQTSMNAASGNVQTITHSIPVITDLITANHDGRMRYVAGNSITFENGFDSGTGEMLVEIDPTAKQDTFIVVATNPLPGINTAAITPLIYTYYDNYNFTGAVTTGTADFSLPQAGTNPYYETNTAVTTQTKGLVTGERVKVLDGNNQWLTTTNFYNNKGRLIQTIADNISGSRDTLTTLYDFSGKMLSTYLRHRNAQSGLTPRTTVRTMTHYDAAGRVDSISKRLNDLDALKRTISLTAYDSIGQLKSKRLGVIGSGQLETLNYDYNIRGWLKGINKTYVNAAGTATNWFGQEYCYDYGFSTNQFNSNIAGVKWKSKSDSISRAYGYTYDNTNRLLGAEFNQVNKGASTWTKDKMDFSVSDLSYDANGNIQYMRRRGVNGTSIQTIDSLKYGYRPNSNKLSYVYDRKNSTTTQLGDFKEIANNETPDYSYDSSGNTISDANKNIPLIRYNYLNLPDSIEITGKGNIRYVYDAVGTKLRKIVTDRSFSPAKVTTTDYINGFVYQNDTLQFLSHEEGRVRAVYKAGQPVDYKYDYFIKDNLGNVRMVLTEQSDFTMYSATMESERAATESALFSNVDESRAAKPVGYPDDQVVVDTSTTDNQFVAKLNAREGGKKIGPAIVLRVMVGDTIQIGTRAFYKSIGPKDNHSASPEDMLAALVQAFTGSTGSGDMSHTDVDQLPAGSPLGKLTSNDFQRLKGKDTEENLLGRPKAYLSFALFDDQFNLVDENSGVRQVKSTPDELQTLAVDKMPIEKSGFLYVYTSNETPQDIYFDNIVVQNITGPLLEETHYYPFGLSMYGITRTAPGKLQNKYLFNGIEKVSDFDIQDYSAQYRALDPQIGRWLQIDPRAESFEDVTPYNHVLNDPINMSDPFGDDTVHVNDLPAVWPDFNTQEDIVALTGVVVTPSQAHTDYYFGPHIGYKVLAKQSWLGHFFNGDRNYGGRAVSTNGILEARRLPTMGIPNELVNAAGLEGGTGLLKVGNSFRRIIRSIDWSSRSVARAAKLLASGTRDVVVKTRAEAEELYLGLYHGKGFKNTTGMTATEAKRFFGKKGTYHWDDAVDEAGDLINHGANNPHAAMKHLQVHDERGIVYRIFFE